MGMFDSIYMDVKCPKCNIVTKGQECQTKDLKCNLDKYYVGSKVKIDSDYLYCGSVMCKSEVCGYDVVIKPTFSVRRGEFFSIHVLLDEEGVITGEYEYTGLH